MVVHIGSKERPLSFLILLHLNDRPVWLNNAHLHPNVYFHPHQPSIIPINRGFKIQKSVVNSMFGTSSPFYDVIK